MKAVVLVGVRVLGPLQHILVRSSIVRGGRTQGTVSLAVQPSAIRHLSRKASSGTGSTMDH